MTYEQFFGLTCSEALKYVGYGHRRVAKRGIDPYAHEIYHLDTNKVVGYKDAHGASDFAHAKFQEIQEKEKNQ
jgi:hypothetical protein